MEERVDRMSNCMRIRGSTVEHPFGTIKSWLGPTHFQMETLKHVSTEMSLHVLAYNLKRMLQIVGAVPLMEAMRAQRGIRAMRAIEIARIAVFTQPLPGTELPGQQDVMHYRAHLREKIIREAALRCINLLVQNTIQSSQRTFH